jgi:hypothetical protein
MKEKCIEPLKTISNREKKIADLPGRGLDSKGIAKTTVLAGILLIPTGVTL